MRGEEIAAIVGLIKAYQVRVNPTWGSGSLSLWSPCSPPASKSELMCCLRIADGLNTTTLRGKITLVPVLGLRPTRWPFLRTTKEPNEESFTVAPCSRQSVTSLSTSSTSVADSFHDKPTF